MSYSQLEKVGGRGRRGCPRWLWAIMLGCALWLGSGCVGPAHKADRAMELGNYSAALEHYEAAIEHDDQNPDLYYSAARAAQRQGAFAKAERYFSQSLRYGGDNQVARALAEFYIQTSNFGSAVRIFQYLMHTEEDLQPLYSNMGTALMYGGNYMDAESYLLSAQQMDPSDPVPYINLGVLYDRHIRNRAKAVVFYQCYTELSRDDKQARTVGTRIQEIQNRGAVDTSRVFLTCGEAYEVVEHEVDDVSRVFNLETGEFEEVDPDDLPEAPEPEELDLEPQFEDIQDDPVLDEEEAQDSEIETEVTDEVEASEEVDAADSYRRAEEAFEDGRFDEAAEYLEAIPDDERELDAQTLLGQAYYRIGRYALAGEYLEKVIVEQPDPELVQRLLTVYDETQDETAKQEICERFAGWPDYAEALGTCD